jgi:serine/threonine-protein kinase
VKRILPFLFSLCATSIPAQILALPIDNIYLGIAGAGGDFSSRTATLRVPDKTTTQQVKYGLRLYDLHVAKMIEVTNNYCRDRESKYIIHWNYMAEDGKIYMGKYDISCQLAQDTMKKFGNGKLENVSIDYAGNIEKVQINPLNLNSKNAQEFAKLVQSLKPNCMAGSPPICPGDRLE